MSFCSAAGGTWKGSQGAIKERHSKGAAGIWGTNHQPWWFRWPSLVDSGQWVSNFSSELTTWSHPLMAVSLAKLLQCPMVWAWHLWVPPWELHWLQIPDYFQLVGHDRLWWLLISGLLVSGHIIRHAPSLLLIGCFLNMRCPLRHQCPEFTAFTSFSPSLAI